MFFSSQPVLALSVQYHAACLNINGFDYSITSVVHCGNLFEGLLLLLLVQSSKSEPRDLLVVLPLLRIKPMADAPAAGARRRKQDLPRRSEEAERMKEDLLLVVVEKEEEKRHVSIY